MRFHFHLDSVLQIRKLLEQKELQQLEQLQRDAVVLRRQLDTLRSEHSAALRAQEDALSAGISALELHGFYGTTYQIVNQIRMTAAKLHQNRHQQALQLERYQKAHADCELLAGIRQREFDDFQAKAAREEQKRLDDLVGSRWKQRR